MELNTIKCGDCLQVMKGMADFSVDLILTDPPYGMAYQSAWRTEQHDKIVADEDLTWFPDFIKEAYRVLKDNTHLYIFCNDYCISLLCLTPLRVREQLAWRLKLLKGIFSELK